MCNSHSQVQHPTYAAHYSAEIYWSECWWASHKVFYLTWILFMALSYYFVFYIAWVWIRQVGRTFYEVLISMHSIIWLIEVKTMRLLRRLSITWSPKTADLIHNFQITNWRAKWYSVFFHFYINFNEPVRIFNWRPENI